MAAPIIGRTTCPFCGSTSATVRRGDGKHPYAYCGECGGTAHARNGHQAAGLLARMRPDGSTSSTAEPAGEPDSGELQASSAVDAPPVTRRIDASAPPAPPPSTRPARSARGWGTLL